MRTSTAVLMICLWLSSDLRAQSGVIISPEPTPDEPGAILHVQSSNQGVLLPRTRMDSVLFPVNGLLIFDTVFNSFMFYDSIQWVALVKTSDIVFSYFYADRDGDSWGDPLAALYAPSPPPGYVTGLDCDDTDPDVAPGMPELCDGVDNDCNVGTIDGIDEDTLNTPCEWCRCRPMPRRSDAVCRWCSRLF